MYRPLVKPATIARIKVSRLREIRIDMRGKASWAPVMLRADDW